MSIVKGMMTSKEAAERLEVSNGRIRQLIANETFRSIKIGNTRLIAEQSIIDYAEVQRKGKVKGNS